jgi:hypothetical protein
MSQKSPVCQVRVTALLRQLLLDSSATASFHAPETLGTGTPRANCIDIEN